MMQDIIKKQNTVAVAVVNIFAVFFACISAVSVFIYKEKDPLSAPLSAPVAVAKPDPFLNISLHGKSAYVFDTVTGKVLFSKNEEAQLPLASVTKVMTALVASRAPGNTDVRINAHNLTNGSGGLAEGENWNLKDLLNYTLMVSSNSGASAIAGAAGSVFRDGGEGKGEEEDIFVGKMNETAEKLGMAQTYYLNPSGLDMNEMLSGAYGSAKDMSILFDFILKTQPSLLSATAYETLPYYSENGTLHRAENTNIITRSVPGLIAGKTGYTNLANGNLVIAFNVGPMRPVIIAVLDSTEEGRFVDVAKLVDASIKKISDGD
jgi:D-alanyl-D-alanine carboxypeptidase